MATTTAETTKDSITRPRVKKPAARAPAIAAVPVTDGFAAELTGAFVEAVRTAVADAHADGLAIPVSDDIEVRPDGQTHPIDDTRAWSPLDWRTKA
jgi:hypothetical protein